jgi:tyrosyl-tRNA synthetase
MGGTDPRRGGAARESQRVLAEDVTTLVHGDAECGRVVAASQALFGHGELTGLDEETLAAALAEVAPFRLAVGSSDATGTQPLGADGAARGDRGELASVASLMVAAGLVPTLSAARCTIAEGGAYLNNRRVTAQDSVAAESDLLHGRYLALRRGKRAIGAVEVVRGAP